MINAIYLLLSIACGALGAIVAGIITHVTGHSELVNFVTFTCFLAFSAIAFIGITIGSVKN